MQVLVMVGVGGAMVGGRRAMVGEVRDHGVGGGRHHGWGE